MFGLFEKEWSYDSVPDMTGKICLVTGGSSGLGRQSCLELAKKGASVYVIGRDQKKTMKAIKDIINETSNQNIHFLKADFMDLESVCAMADAFLAKDVPLHLLLNNAGIMAPPFELSKDGIESQFATNHFAHFVLTMKLLPVLIKTAPSRIVNLSSVAHEMANSGIKMDDLNLVSSYAPWYRYGETKLANIQFTTHLSKLLLAKGHDKVYVNCCHPGVVNTNLSHNSVYIPKFLTGVIGMFLTTVEKGAKTQMYLAADMEVEEKNLNGLYYIPTAKLGVTTSYGKEDLPAKNLWDWTCKIVKEKLGDKVTIFE